MKTLRPITHTLLHTSTRPLALQCRSQTYNTPTNHERQPKPTTPFRRTFLTNPFDAPAQEISATRILHYPSKVIYEVIADVSSYNQFIPYCQTSVVTKRSQPASDGKTYPEEAKLTVGFNDSASEDFWSRVYCVPGRAVEAVSGTSETTLQADEITHHTPRPAEDQDPTRNGDVLSQLLTRWTLKPYHYKPPPTSALDKETTHMNHKETSHVPGQERTEVQLVVHFKFANPVYAALSQAAAPRVAEKMVDAFEKRVRAVVEGPGNV